MPPLTRRTRAAANSLAPLITFSDADRLILQTQNRGRGLPRAKASKASRSKSNSRVVRASPDARTPQRKAPDQPSVAANSPSSSAESHPDSHASRNQ